MMKNVKSWKPIGKLGRMKKMKIGEHGKLTEKLGKLAKKPLKMTKGAYAKGKRQLRYLEDKLGAIFGPILLGLILCTVALWAGASIYEFISFLLGD